MSSPRPFIIYALPRSRTKWLSEYLAYPGWTVGHDLPVHLHSVDAVKQWLRQPAHGTVETGMAEYWRIVDREIAGIARAVILRPLKDVIDSLERANGHSLPRVVIEDLERREKALHAIAAEHDTLTLTYRDLEWEDAGADLVRHCLGAAQSRPRWQSFVHRNIQLDWQALLQTMGENWPGINHVRAEAEAMLAGDDVIIEPEAWETAGRDGIELGRMHHAQVVPFPWMNYELDHEAFRQMEAAGVLLTLTARLHGRMVGYLVFTLAESWMSKGMLMGEQKMFFVHPDCRGSLPKRLYREGFRQLRLRGARAVMPHHWLSGDERRDGIMRRFFRTLGAVPCELEYMVRLD